MYSVNRNPENRADFAEDNAIYSGIKANKPKKGIPKGSNSFWIPIETIIAEKSA